MTRRIGVPDLLHAQRARDDLRVCGRQADGAFLPEQVRRLQQIHVQRVAFDPLGAVKQLPHARGSTA